jgi:hypothetical protein
MTYISGSLVRTNASFANLAGGATDPSVVVLKYKKDAGATTVVTYPAAPIVRDSAGTYHADLDTTGWGGPGLQHWEIQWSGTGVITAIGDDWFDVEPPSL